MGTSIRIGFLLPLLAIGLAGAEPAEKAGKVSSSDVESAASTPLTEEQKTALAAIDARMAGVEALAAKIDDPEYRATVASQIEDLKKRRLAMEKNFDPGLYEALMHSVISRYQVIALWLKPPALPRPPGTPPATAKSPSTKKTPLEKNSDGLGAY
jgi:hypothetical protein